MWDVERLCGFPMIDVFIIYPPGGTVAVGLSAAYLQINVCPALDVGVLVTPVENILSGLKHVNERGLIRRRMPGRRCILYLLKCEGWTLNDIITMV